MNDNYGADDRVALHTAARRYCVERIAPWSEFPNVHLLKQLQPDRRRWPSIGTDRPEPAVLLAILYEVERMTPGQFASVDELRACLLTIGRTAEAFPLRLEAPLLQRDQPTEAEIQAAMTDVRDAFCSYIKGLPSEDLHEVAPLPYRRVLDVREQQRLWSRLERRWGVTPERAYAGETIWSAHPRLDAHVTPHTLAFDRRPFRAAVPPAHLLEILAQHRVRRGWELRARLGYNHYEMDLSLIEYRVSIDTTDETYWTSEKMDWLLYQSHEDSFTVGGEWLLNAVKIAWPDWSQHLYPGFR